MRSLSEQAPQELGGSFSVLARQKRDHVKLDGLLHELDRVGADDQDRVLRRLYRLVFPHAFAEEAVLWPVIRATLPHGEDLTVEIEQEHQEVNELVQSLESAGERSGERADLLTRLAEVLRMDVRDEEDVLLPQLQEAVSVSQLRMLGIAWEVTRWVAPTRAHPVVARRPPGNVLAALPLSVVDRLRDGVDAMLQRGIAPAVTHRTSRVLTDWAHRIERSSLLPRGEDPSTRRP